MKPRLSIDTKVSHSDSYSSRATSDVTAEEATKASLGQRRTPAHSTLQQSSRPEEESDNDYYDPLPLHAMPSSSPYDFYQDVPNPLSPAEIQADLTLHDTMPPPTTRRSTLTRDLLATAPMITPTESIIDEDATLTAWQPSDWAETAVHFPTTSRKHANQQFIWEFLSNLSLQHLHPLFVAHKVTTGLLPFLTLSHMQAMGIKAVGDCIKLEQGIRQLSLPSPTPSSHASPEPVKTGRRKRNSFSSFLKRFTNTVLLPSTSPSSRASVPPPSPPVEEDDMASQTIYDFASALSVPFHEENPSPLIMSHDPIQEDEEETVDLLSEGALIPRTEVQVLCSEENTVGAIATQDVDTIDDFVYQLSQTFACVDEARALSEWTVCLHGEEGHPLSNADILDVFHCANPPCLVLHPKIAVDTPLSPVEQPTIPTLDRLRERREEKKSPSTPFPPRSTNAELIMKHYGTLFPHLLQTEQRPSTFETYRGGRSGIQQRTRTLIRSTQRRISTLDRVFVKGHDKAAIASSAVLEQSCWYRFGMMLGRGAYSKVFMGLIEDTHELVAIKQVDLPRLSKESGSMADATATMLKREAILLEQLMHPYVVHYKGLHQDGDTVNLLMEFLSGGTLTSYLQRQKHCRLPDATVRDMLRQLCEALSYLHAQGIVHRDVKCDNILLDDKGTIRLADFGLCYSHADQVKEDYQLKGTIRYMSPEAIRKEEVTPKWDVWATGCVLLELYGVRPWASLPIETILWNVCMHHIGPTIPANLDETTRDFLQQCFEIEPKHRPTIDELLLHPLIRDVAPTEPLPKFQYLDTQD